MFILRLNDMRTSHVENLTSIARADTPDELMQLMENEKVEPYSEHNNGHWDKSYQKGGPLEWYNEPFSLEHSIIGVLSEDEWVADARRRYKDEIMSLPTAGELHG